MTPLDIINLSLKNAGILSTGQTANAEMTNDGFTIMNAMIGQWAAKRWLVYHLVNLSIRSTGAISYSVGPGGDFNIPIRPTEIDAAFVSQNLGQFSQIDTPITMLMAREDYNRLAMKQLVAFPYVAFYDNGYPMGTVYFWPSPSPNLYGVTITVKMALQNFATLQQDINLPNEYQEALIYNLAIRLRTRYQMDLEPALLGLARSALSTVRMANTQIALLQMPAAIGGGGRYNVYSNQNR